MWDWIYNHVMALITQHPELLAIGFGGLVFPIAASQTYRMVWIDPAATAAYKLKVMSSIDFGASFIFTAGMWQYLDHDDPLGLRLLVSLGVAVTCFLVHWIGQRIILKHWPWIEAPPT